MPQFWSTLRARNSPLTPWLFSSMSYRTAAIDVEDLVKVYHENSRHPVRALDGLSLTVEQGRYSDSSGRTAPARPHS